MPQESGLTTAQERLTVGSLFSGIGGLDLGLERAGMIVKWQVENDPYCIKVLEKHWPNVQRYEDVRTVGSDLEPVDLICGGFPCQDVSIAGKRAGIEGARSGLWTEFARIVRLLRPRIVLVENVPGLLSSGFGRVLGDLAESGYDAEWDCIPAAAVGAPHLRYRVFIVGYSVEPGLQIGQTFRSDMEQKLATSERTSDEVANTKNPNRWGPNDQEDQGWRNKEAGRCCEFGRRAEYWSIEPNVGRVADGVPNRVDRLRSLGNAVVPQVAEWIGRRIMKVVAYGNDGWMVRYEDTRKPHTHRTTVEPRSC